MGSIALHSQFSKQDGAGNVLGRSSLSPCLFVRAFLRICFVPICPSPANPLRKNKTSKQIRRFHLRTTGEGSRPCIRSGGIVGETGRNADSRRFSGRISNYLPGRIQAFWRNLGGFLENLGESKPLDVIPLFAPLLIQSFRHLIEKPFR